MTQSKIEGRKTPPNTKSKWNANAKITFLYHDDTLSKCYLYEWMTHKKHKDIAVEKKHGIPSHWGENGIKRTKMWHAFSDACSTYLGKKTESNVRPFRESASIAGLFQRTLHREKKSDTEWEEDRYREKEEQKKSGSKRRNYDDTFIFFVSYTTIILVW